MEQQFVYKSTLTKCGFTADMIAALGDPDQYVPNPHRTSEMVGVYFVETVKFFLDSNAAVKAVAERKFNDHLAEIGRKAAAGAQAKEDAERRKRDEYAKMDLTPINYVRSTPIPTFRKPEKIDFSKLTTNLSKREREDGRKF